MMGIIRFLLLCKVYNFHFNFILQKLFCHFNFFLNTIFPICRGQWQYTSTIVFRRHITDGWFLTGFHLVLMISTAPKCHYHYLGWGARLSHNSPNTRGGAKIMTDCPWIKKESGNFIIVNTSSTFDMDYKFNKVFNTSRLIWNSM